MTSFNFDISETNSQIIKYKAAKRSCMEDAYYLYKNINGVLNAWNDVNAYTFVSTTVSDYENVKAYYNYLDACFNEIEIFKRDIDNYCRRLGYTQNSVALHYNDSDIQNCRNYFNTAMYYMNTAESLMNECRFNYKFPYRYLFSTIKTNINRSSNNTYRVLRDVNNFVEYINSAVYNSKIRCSKIENPGTKLKPMDYTNKIIDIKK